MPQLNEVDSLIANEFSFEINGDIVSGVFHIKHFVLYATDEQGNRIKPSFEVTKMVQRDSNRPFNQWHHETITARNSDEKPRRDVTITAIDDGVETRRWTAKNAWIQAIRYSDFDTGSFEMVAETYVIAYDDIEEVWSISDDS